jgi:hypothetical protein
MILFAQLDNPIAGRRLLRPGLRAMARRHKEDGVALAPEVMGQDMEGTGRITEGRGDFARRVTLDEKSPERFVLALLGLAGFEEETANGA